MFYQFSRIIFEKSDGDQMYSLYYSNSHSFQVVVTPPMRMVTDMVLDDNAGPYGMTLMSSADQHGVSIRELERDQGYYPNMHRTSFRKNKFVRRQFMIIMTNMQTFEGVALKTRNGDIEYICGFITYSDGRVEKV